MATKWIGRIAALALGGAMVPIGAWAFGDYLPPTPVTAAELIPALDAPPHEPWRALPEVDRGVTRFVDGRARVDFEIPARDCALFVFGGATPYPIDSGSLFASDTQQLLVHRERAHAGALGWCAGVQPLAVTYQAQDNDDVEGLELHWRLRSGSPTRTWSEYVAGDADPDAWRALASERDRDEGLERLSPIAGELLFEWDAPPDAAWTLPASEGTRWAARALGTLGVDDPEYEPRLLEGATGAIVGSHPPGAILDEGHWRLLLVIDASDLPVDGAVPCVKVHLDRISAVETTPQRIALPSLDRTVLEGADPLCPGDGLVAYATSRDDGSVWRIRVERDQGATARRRPSPVPHAALVQPHHARTLAECDAGDADACARVATHYESGRYVVADDEQAFAYHRRACEGAAEHCGPYGDLLARRDEVSEAVAAWRRGCDADSAWACASLGEALRRGRGVAFDARAAHQAYRRACELGASPACARAATMVELQLAES